MSVDIQEKILKAKRLLVKGNNDMNNQMFNEGLVLLNEVSVSVRDMNLCKSCLNHITFSHCPLCHERMK